MVDHVAPVSMKEGTEEGAIVRGRRISASLRPLGLPGTLRICRPSFLNMLLPFYSIEG
jgi:hypothetical protein